MERIAIAVFITGASGLIAQVVLLRELLTIFQGNELSVGIILSNWLILEAVGSYIGGKGVEKIRKRVEFFYSFSLFFSLSLVVGIYAVRLGRLLLKSLPGEGVGIGGMLLLSFLVLLPVSFPHGALFSIATRIYPMKRGRQSAGRMYFWESLGTTTGGVILNFYLLPRYHSFQISLGIVVTMLIVGILLFYKSKNAFIFTAITALLIALFPIIPKHLHEKSINQEWKGENPIYYADSIYGNMVVGKKGEQYTFFSNGIPVIVTPMPDIFFVEEFSQFPLLLHPHPLNVLVISGGAGGVIAEILKQPVERVDYVEIDPLIIKTLEKFPTPISIREFSDPRLHLHFTDGRHFLSTTHLKYDVIFIGISDLGSLQRIRFFTQEFFNIVRDHLRSNGILCFTLPGSFSYLTEDILLVNRNVWESLKGIFPHIFILPGDYHIFLAFKSKEKPIFTSSVLKERMEKRNLTTILSLPDNFALKTSPQYLGWLSQNLAKVKAKANKDLKPVGVFYFLIYWSEKFSPRLAPFLKIFMRKNCLLYLFLLLPFLFFPFHAGIKRKSVGYAIFTTGFAGMLLNLMVTFVFQIYRGYLYYQITLLITAFMGGMAVGSILMSKWVERGVSPYRILISGEIYLIIFSLLLPFLFSMGKAFFEKSPLGFPFLILSFFAGLPVGAEFPAGNFLYGRERPGETAGILYAQDLLGGWLGGFLGGVFFFPLMGVLKSSGIISILKILSLIFLLHCLYKERKAHNH
ncbi:hypothetical protein J7K56_03775 [Candidatus Calescamantes bacterium]|nr:hypothetical protein [Candidatus Calescamantes bacterium]